MKEKLLKDKAEVEALFYSRPLSLPGSAFGALNVFFDPVELDQRTVEKLGHYLTTCIEQFFLSADGVKSDDTTTIDSKDRIIN